MAYKSFNQRFPAFKWALLLAVLITLPLTVFSVQKVSTSTEQHAAALTCGPSGKNPSCPGGYYCTYTAGNPTFGGTCTYAISAPTGLNSSSWYCKIGTPKKEYDTVNFWWNKVPSATSYTLYYRVYASGDAYIGVSLPGNNNTQHIVSSLRNLNGRRVQWYVKATNSLASNQSSAITTKAAFLSCE